MQVLIKNAHILNVKSKYHQKKKDIFIQDGIIQKIATHINEKADYIIQAPNSFVSLGWVDIFADFCEPGFEHKETIESGIQTAAAGGYTDVFLIPNLFPTTSSKANVEFLKSENQIVNTHPIGSISNQLKGKELAEMSDMNHAGAIAFSDGTQPVQNAGLLLKALQYVKTFDGILIEIPEDQSLTLRGLMNEGITSTQIGLQGKPALAEDTYTFRNIELLNYTQSKLHLTGVSTKKSIEMIKQAKKKNQNLTCSVTPYHLLYNETALINYNTHFKVTPPLRSEEDRKALIKAIQDGTIDCIASHHIPQTFDEKQLEFEYAKNGMISLQVMLSMLLKLDAQIPIEKWIELLSENPRKIFKLPQPKIEEGEAATLTVFNLNEQWKFDKKK
ncbi:MAG: dihydroorotase, multifunctional complex type [Bacteroidetes bacterium OLB11]|nr:MAG: dihydroorotase, multifunctional complex type [Bacteroidetes bacterium OLB11]